MINQDVSLRKIVSGIKNKKDYKTGKRWKKKGVDILNMH